MLSTIVAVTAIAAFAVLIAVNFRRTEARKRAMPEQLLGPLRSILDDVIISAGEAAGVYELTGRYRGHLVSVKAVTDLLMVRKLPPLWLMVTLPGEIPVPGKLDMMVRAASASSFSNFDFLPISLPSPVEAPEGASFRADCEAAASLMEPLRPYLRELQAPRVKELLITPMGLRLVSLAAEADRARYGVYRQADFGDAQADAQEVRRQLDLLLRLKSEFMQSARISDAA